MLSAPEALILSPHTCCCLELFACNCYTTHLLSIKHDESNPCEYVSSLSPQTFTCVPFLFFLLRLIYIMQHVCVTQTLVTVSNFVLAAVYVSTYPFQQHSAFSFQLILGLSFHSRYLFYSVQQNELDNYTTPTTTPCASATGLFVLHIDSLAKTLTL